MTLGGGTATGPHALDPQQAPTPRPRRPRHRRTRLIRTRSRTWALLGVLAALAATVPMLGLAGFHTIWDSREGRTIERAGRSAEITLPATPVQYLVAVDASGAASSIVVFALSPEGAGGWAIMVPVGAAAEPPGLGPASFAAAYAHGGLALLGDTIEGYFGVTTEQGTAVDAGAWGLLVKAPVTVSLEDPVGVADAEGKLVELFPQGDVTLQPDDVPTLLEARAPNESDVTRLLRHQAFWQGYFASLGASLPPPTTTVATTTTTVSGDGPTTTVVAPPPPLDEFLERVAAAEVNVVRLPADPDGTWPDGSERYVVDPVEVTILAAQAMPGSVSPSDDEPRVRVVNATASRAALVALTRQLGDLGFNLVFASDAPGREAATSIVYGPDSVAAAAEFLARSLEVADPGREPVIDGIDITIVLGTDFMERVAPATVATTVAPTTVKAPATTRRPTATTSRTGATTTRRAPATTAPPTTQDATTSLAPDTSSAATTAPPATGATTTTASTTTKAPATSSAPPTSAAPTT